MKTLFLCLFALTLPACIFSKTDRKVVLVTGASRGTVKAIALHLAKAGYTVYATMRNPNGSNEMEKLKTVYITLGRKLMKINAKIQLKKSSKQKAA